MRRTISFLIAGLWVTGLCKAQDNNYAASLIPPALLKNSNAVKRMDETRIVIDNIGKATIYYKYAVTVLNERGNDLAFFHEEYDKFLNVEDIEGRLYDADGNKISSVKKNDITDVSVNSITDEELMSDDRIKVFSFQHSAYPYTVEFEYKVNMTGIFYFPEWQPAESEKFSVQSSKLFVEVPSSYQLRYKAFNYNGDPVVTTKNDTKIFEWSVDSIQAITEQQYEPEWYELVPTVFLAPSDFKIYDYTGNMQSWKELGKFVYTLNLGRDELPDDIRHTVHSLTDNVADVHEKIKILYQYFQKNTRYVNIKLGIGGWQPYDAKYVADKGYGDCKALSNYMHSLLKEAGIRSCYTLIKAGDYNTDFLEDFPSTQFNHIIVCVPLQNDTTWLECTSSTLPAGYLSGFTCNRFALLIDENGGTLVHTPRYGMNNNLQVRNINATLDSNGLLEASVTTRYTAMQQDDLHEILNGLSNEKISEYLKEEIDLPSYDVKKFDYKEDKQTIPSIDETLQLESKNYAAVSGKRLFIVPDILNRYHNRLKDFDERTCDIVLRAEYKDIDSVQISIPPGYVAESVPADIDLVSKFGEYHSAIHILPDKIIYYRIAEKNSGRFAPSDAKVLADFFEKIYKADRAKIVLVKVQ